MKENVNSVLNLGQLDKDLKLIADKVLAGKRISASEGVTLYQKGTPGMLAVLSSEVKRRINGDVVFFNRNFHLEPTNICIYRCKFCAYSRSEGDEGSWILSKEKMLEIVKNESPDATEVHIVGGVHPQRGLDFYCDLIRGIKEVRPDLHVKAFTAVEIDYMIRKSGLSLEDGLVALRDAGLNSIPGGGAEIFDEAVRSRICGEKSTGAIWLKVHEAAHQNNLPSNATMLYGHVENYTHRIDHLLKLRELQDRTNGFNAFIPLKFRNSNSEFSHIEETTLIEDMKNYAVSRIFLDNIPHIKAYWPMIGLEKAQLSLSYGVDDLDGTINDSTKIYSMAGVKEKQSQSAEDIISLIKAEGMRPVERDSVYNKVRQY